MTPPPARSRSQAVSRAGSPAPGPAGAAAGLKHYKEEGGDITATFHSMRAAREKKRELYIRQGVLPDPTKAQDLGTAQAFRGTCPEMCPEFERIEREMQKELDPLEVIPGTLQCDPNVAVKIYRRPAAGREVPLPEDVRPPEMLKTTLDYLFHDLLPSQPYEENFNQIQAFIWNRTRAIRQDFIVQNERGILAIECHERIARYHILTLHFRGGLAQRDGVIREEQENADGTRSENTWSEQQELEQLRKSELDPNFCRVGRQADKSAETALRSLIEFYDDQRLASNDMNAAASPNEPEFRSYNLLLHLRDPETLREVESLPESVFTHPFIQSSLRLRGYAQKSNNVVRRGQPRNEEATLNWFSRFFRELRSERVNYLQACLAENLFGEVRVGALKALARCFRAQFKPLATAWIAQNLGFDSEEQAADLAKQLGLKVDGAAIAVHQEATFDEDKPPSTPFSMTLVEAKRGNKMFQEIVDGQYSPVKKVPVPTFATPTFTAPNPQQTQVAAPVPQKESAPAPAFVFSSPSATAAPAFSQPAAPKPSAPQPFSFASAPQASSQPAKAVLSPFASPFKPIESPKETARAPPAFSFEAKPQPPTPSFKPTATLPPPKLEPNPAPQAVPRPSQTEPTSVAVQVSPPKPNQPPTLRPAPKSAERAPASPPTQMKKTPLPAASREKLLRNFAKGLFDSLASEAQAPAVEMLAAKEVRGELVRRAQEARVEKISHMSRAFLAQLIDGMSEVTSEKVAREAVATDVGKRSVLKRVLERWRRKTTERQQWKQIRERSSQLPEARGMKRSRKTTISVEVTTVTPDEMDDSLAHAFEERQRTRKELWKPESISLLIVQHFAKLREEWKGEWPDRLTVLFDLAQSATPQQTWLQTVLNETECALGSTRSKLTIATVRTAQQAINARMRINVALVIFEVEEGSESAVRFQTIQSLMHQLRASGLSHVGASLLVLCWQPPARPDSLQQAMPGIDSWSRAAVVHPSLAEVGSGLQRAVPALAWMPTVAPQIQSQYAIMHRYWYETLQAMEASLAMVDKSTNWVHFHAGCWRALCQLGNLRLRLLAEVWGNHLVPQYHPTRGDALAVPVPDPADLFTSYIETISSGPRDRRLELLKQELMAFSSTPKCEQRASQPSIS